MATDSVNLTLLLVEFVQQTSPPANFAYTKHIPEQINLQEFTFLRKEEYW